ncbi:MAG: spore cortex biosynthesis protein YabQ [Clostridia bacterium]|nr:spore cortex biosynthesis protein YabQ [Clostridia bacterium]
MEISQTGLAWLYVYALLLGFGLGGAYDLLRITRVFLGVHYSRRAAKRLQAIRLPFLKPYQKKKESPALGVVVFIEDFFFCIFAGISIILLFYIQNHGKIRFPAFLCIGAGFFFYRATLGRLVMLFSEVIAFLMETVVGYTVFFVLYPIRAMAKWVRKRIRRVMTASVRVHRKHRRRHFTAEEYARGKRNACGLIPGDIPKQKKLKRGKQVVSEKEKTVQSHVADARASRSPGGRGYRDIRQ